MGIPSFPMIVFHGTTPSSCRPGCPGTIDQQWGHLHCATQMLALRRADGLRDGGLVNPVVKLRDVVWTGVGKNVPMFHITLCFWGYNNPTDIWRWCETNPQKGTFTNAWRIPIQHIRLERCANLENPSSFHRSFSGIFRIYKMGTFQSHMDGGTPSHHPFSNDGIFPTKTIQRAWGKPITMETPILRSPESSCNMVFFEIYSNHFWTIS